MSSAVSPQRVPALIESLAQRVDRYLSARLAATRIAPNLREAVEYAVLGPGKRLRPTLVLLSCRAVGGDDEAQIPGSGAGSGTGTGTAAAAAGAGALELIHAFSLVHDDLPAMDDDALRRGRPTLHVHAGEAMAILAGDVMLSLAFEWLAEVKGEVSARLTAELARATTDMISGQVYDTLGGFPDHLSEPDRLHLIHRHKTGALLQAACRMGAISGGATPAQLDALTRFGETIGLMYQIVDDLLDVTQSTEHLGKAAGKDDEAGKLTFPGLLGVERSREEVKRCEVQAIEALEPLGEAADPLRSLCRYMATRTR